MAQGDVRLRNTRAAVYGPYNYFSYEGQCYDVGTGAVANIAEATGATWTAPFVAAVAGDQAFNMPRENALLNNNSKSQAEV